MEQTIRLATEGDADAITAIYTPFVEQTHISFETHPPTVEEMAQRIRNTVERLPWLVCEYDGQITGYAYASTHNERPAYQWAVDVSVYVNEAWRRKGIASALYDSLFALLDRQGLRNAYAVIALPNPRSVTFHESRGFEKSVYTATSDTRTGSGVMLATGNYHFSPLRHPHRHRLLSRTSETPTDTPVHS
ncbi:GNAT family N-acetyltransferase [Saliphagus sp. GCM10025308]